MTGDLVGPLVPVTYWPGDWQTKPVTLHYDLPQDTRDVRSQACVAHHPACACREASTAEHIRELAHDARDVARYAAALRAIAALHDKHDDRCRACFELWPCLTRNLTAPAYPITLQEYL